MFLFQESDGGLKLDELKAFTGVEPEEIKQKLLTDKTNKNIDNYIQSVQELDGLFKQNIFQDIAMVGGYKNMPTKAVELLNQVKTASSDSERENYIVQALTVLDKMAGEIRTRIPLLDLSVKEKDELVKKGILKKEETGEGENKVVNYRPVSLREYLGVPWWTVFTPGLGFPVVGILTMKDTDPTSKNTFEFITDRTPVVGTPGEIADLIFCSITGRYTDWTDYATVSADAIMDATIVLSATKFAKVLKFWKLYKPVKIGDKVVDQTSILAKLNKTVREAEFVKEGTYSIRMVGPDGKLLDEYVGVIFKDGKLSYAVTEMKEGKEVVKSTILSKDGTDVHTIMRESKQTVAGDELLFKDGNRFLLQEMDASGKTTVHQIRMKMPVGDVQKLIIETKTELEALKVTLVGSTVEATEKGPVKVIMGSDGKVYVDAGKGAELNTAQVRLDPISLEYLKQVRQIEVGADGLVRSGGQLVYRTDIFRKIPFLKYKLSPDVLHKYPTESEVLSKIKLKDTKSFWEADKSKLFKPSEWEKKMINTPRLTSTNPWWLQFHIPNYLADKIPVALGYASWGGKAYLKTQMILPYLWTNMMMSANLRVIVARELLHEALLYPNDYTITPPKLKDKIGAKDEIMTDVKKDDTPPKGTLPDSNKTETKEIQLDKISQTAKDIWTEVQKSYSKDSMEGIRRDAIKVSMDYKLKTKGYNNGKDYKEDPVYKSNSEKYEGWTPEKFIDKRIQDGSIKTKDMNGQPLNMEDMIKSLKTILQGDASIQPKRRLNIG